jgi:integrase
VRQGFLSRENLEVLAARLDEDLADVVRFLFSSAWRVGEVRTLEWRDYDRAEGTIRLRPEHGKNAQGRVLPIVADLAAVIERRMQKRRLDCPRSFIATANGSETSARRGRLRVTRSAWPAASSTTFDGAVFAI